MNTIRRPSSSGRRDFLQVSAASLWLASRAAMLWGAEPGETLPIDQRIQALADTAPLAMQFRGHTAEEARRWQAEFGAKLRSLLGPHRPPEKWECVLERRVELADHVREERLLTASGLAPVPVHLLLPRGQAKWRAGILAIHGHGQFAHDGVAGIDDTPERRAEIERFQYDYGRKLVQRGYVVAAPCLTPFARRLGVVPPKGSDVCTTTNLKLQYCGKLLVAENLRDLLWTLEFLLRQETVDAQRIGCVGLSYGGYMTMLATALEPRIRVAAIAGALNCFQDRMPRRHGTAGCQLIPALLEFGDNPEIAGLIAPRPCVWTAGSGDPQISAEWAEKMLERIGRVYNALGAAGRLYVDRFEGVHQWHGDLAYPVLEKVLRG